MAAAAATCDHTSEAPYSNWLFSRVQPATYDGASLWRPELPEAVAG